MNIPYQITTEEESALFDRRIKLAELIILTITALLIIKSSSQIISYVWPVLLLSIDLIFIILTIIFGSNRTRKTTTFDDDNKIVATKKEISYQLYWPDIVSFSVYILSILLTTCVIFS